MDCRMVGCGGTTVTFYATPGGVKAVWTNENCPYDNKGITIDRDTDEASDGHNVSFLSWEDLDAMTRHRSSQLKRGLPTPQPKKGKRR